MSLLLRSFGMFPFATALCRSSFDIARSFFTPSELPPLEAESLAFESLAFEVEVELAGEADGALAGGA
jgi:hypothetical protein